MSQDHIAAFLAGFALGRALSPASPTPANSSPGRRSLVDILSDRRARKSRFGGNPGKKNADPIAKTKDDSNDAEAVNSANLSGQFSPDPGCDQMYAELMERIEKAPEMAKKCKEDFEEGLRIEKKLATVAFHIEEQEELAVPTPPEFHCRHGDAFPHLECSRLADLSGIFGDTTPLDNESLLRDLVLEPRIVAQDEPTGVATDALSSSTMETTQALSSSTEFASNSTRHDSPPSGTSSPRSSSVATLASSSRTSPSSVTGGYPPSKKAAQKRRSPSPSGMEPSEKKLASTPITDSTNIRRLPSLLFSPIVPQAATPAETPSAESSPAEPSPQSSGVSTTTGSFEVTSPAPSLPSGTPEVLQRSETPRKRTAAAPRSPSSNPKRRLIESSPNAERKKTENDKPSSSTKILKRSTTPIESGIPPKKRFSPKSPGTPPSSSSISESSAASSSTSGEVLRTARSPSPAPMPVAVHRPALRTPPPLPLPAPPAAIVRPPPALPMAPVVPRIRILNNVDAQAMRDLKKKIEVALKVILDNWPGIATNHRLCQRPIILDYVEAIQRHRTTLRRMKRETETLLTTPNNITNGVVTARANAFEKVKKRVSSILSTIERLSS